MRPFIGREVLVLLIVSTPFLGGAFINALMDDRVNRDRHWSSLLKNAGIVPENVVNPNRDALQGVRQFDVMVVMELIQLLVESSFSQLRFEYLESIGRECYTSYRGNSFVKATL